MIKPRKPKLPQNVLCIYMVKVKFQIRHTIITLIQGQAIIILTFYELMLESVSEDSPGALQSILLSPHIHRHIPRTQMNGGSRVAKPIPDHQCTKWLYLYPPVIGTGQKSKNNTQNPMSAIGTMISCMHMLDPRKIANHQLNKLIYLTLL